MCFLKIGGVQNNFKCVNERFVVFFIFFGPIWTKFAIGKGYKMYLVLMSFVKIGAVKAILYLKAHVNFFLYFPQIWLIFGIIDKHVILLSVVRVFLCIYLSVWERLAFPMGAN